METLNLEQVRQSLDEQRLCGGGVANESSFIALQVAIYVMCGGGMLGRFAAEQPADFYIDDRVGRLPYKQSEIYQAVAVLNVLAQVQGKDPHKLPAVPAFHACGIW